MKNTVSKPLHITFIAPFGLRAKGTVAARVLPIAETLAAQGHSLRVIIPPWDDPAGSPDLALTQPRRETVNGVEQVLVPVQPGPQPIKIPLRLVQETLAGQPDVIHIFKPKAFSGLAALLVKLRGMNFILDSDDWEGPGGYNDVNDYSFLQKQLFGWQERDLPRRAKGVTVASRTLQTQAWGFGVAPERVFYLPNGVSAHKYAGWGDHETLAKTGEWRQRLGLAEDDIVLLAYTRFAEFKPERLLEILRTILHELPPEMAERVRLLVVGGGFRGEEKEFKALAAPYMQAERIILTGSVALADLPSLLRCGDVALYPFDDNLINRARCSAKFLDLLMAERPVVAEAVGELPHYLKDGEGGILVPPGDKEAFAKAVVHLIQLPAPERLALGLRAARRLQAEFSWQKLVEPLEAFYRASTARRK